MISSYLSNPHDGHLSIKKIIVRTAHARFGIEITSSLIPDEISIIKPHMFIPAIVSQSEERIVKSKLKFHASIISNIRASRLLRAILLTLSIDSYHREAVVIAALCRLLTARFISPQLFRNRSNRIL